MIVDLRLREGGVGTSRRRHTGGFAQVGDARDADVESESDGRHRHWGLEVNKERRGAYHG